MTNSKTPFILELDHFLTIFQWLKILEIVRGTLRSILKDKKAVYWLKLWGHEGSFVAISLSVTQTV